MSSDTEEKNVEVLTSIVKQTLLTTFSSIFISYEKIWLWNEIYISVKHN